MNTITVSMTETHETRALLDEQENEIVRITRALPYAEDWWESAFGAYAEALPVMPDPVPDPAQIQAQLDELQAQITLLQEAGQESEAAALQIQLDGLAAQLALLMGGN